MFDKFISQDKVKNGLINSIQNNKLSHTYLFSGEDGLGKISFAKEVAQNLICSNIDLSIGKIEKCGECISCNLFENGTNPDYMYIQSVDDTISIDVIRGLTKNINIKPFYATKKIYIIESVDKMTRQAQNSLLKTIEEPPNYCLIIMTTEKVDSLLDTIKSRVIKYNFAKYSKLDIEKFFRMNNMDIDNLSFIYEFSNGSIGKAVNTYNNDSIGKYREESISLIENISKNNVVFEGYNFFNQNKEELETIFHVMTTIYRDILNFKVMKDENLLINLDKKDIILKQISKYSTHTLVKNIETLELSYKRIKSNANFQLTIENMLITLQEE